MKNFFSCLDGIEIIDFHTHPFVSDDSNICAYKKEFKIDPQNTVSTMKSFGISKMAGSVIRLDRENFKNPLDKVIAQNRDALKLRDSMSGFLVPGFHIHPDYVEESIEEIRFMADNGVFLIGELVPYHDSWELYDHKGLLPILNEAAKYDMTVSFHTMANETIEKMVASHPDVNFVAAHPGERGQIEFHVSLMKKYKNLSLDISGTGVFRYHAVRYLVNEVGSERIIFGTDFPVCNPGVYIGGVLAEPLSDKELENIFSLNAKRLLKIK